DLIHSSTRDQNHHVTDHLHLKVNGGQVQFLTNTLNLPVVQLDLTGGVLSGDLTLSGTFQLPDASDLRINATVGLSFSADTATAAFTVHGSVTVPGLFPVSGSIKIDGSLASDGSGSLTV